MKESTYILIGAILTVAATLYLFILLFYIVVEGDDIWYMMFALIQPLFMVVGRIFVNKEKNKN